MSCKSNTDWVFALHSSGRGSALFAVLACAACGSSPTVPMTSSPAMTAPSAANGGSSGTAGSAPPPAVSGSGGSVPSVSAGTSAPPVAGGSGIASMPKAGASSGSSGSGGDTAESAGSGGAAGVTSGQAGTGGATAEMSAGSSGAAGAAATPTTADLAKPGPYKTMRLKNQGKGTISGASAGTLGEGGDDASAFTLFIPQGTPAGAKFPLLTWGNGTFCSPSFYDSLMDFIVSYGYVVIATNTSNAGSGTEMLKAVEWAIAQNDVADSPLHGLIDANEVGAFGHSQGGEGAVNTGADPRIKALAPLSAGPKGSGEANIKVPTFYTLTASDVVTPDSYRASYDDTKAPAAYGVTKGGDHLEYCDKAEDPGLPGLTSNDAEMTRSAITAWFEWQLKGKQELKPLFVGADCGFCKDANWKSFESKGF